MRGFLLWTRVAWWAALVGLVELLLWLSGSRHGRATATGALLAWLAGMLVLLHPALAPITHAPARTIDVQRGPAPAGPACPALLQPVLIDAVTGQQISIVYPLPSTPPPVRIVPPSICPLHVLPVPLAHADLHTSDLVYRTTERRAASGALASSAVFRGVPASVASFSGQAQP